MQKFFTLILVICSTCLLQAQEDIVVPKTQKSLITKRTATWCPNCGASRAWDLKAEMIQEHTGKALVIAGHHSRGSQLYSGAAEDLIDNFQTTFSQPVFYFNNVFIGTGGENTAEPMRTLVNEAFAEEPLAQTGFEAVYDEVSNKLQVRSKTEFFGNAQGSYYLAFYMIQKIVVEDQSNRGSNVEHPNVLFEAMTPSSFGDLLAQNTIESGSSYLYNLDIELPSELDADNLVIAAVLWSKNEEDKYDFVNLNTVDIVQNGVITSNENAAILQKMEVAPTLTFGNTNLFLDLNSPIENARIDLHTIQGQLINNIYQGRIEAGVQQININIPSRGSFLVVLRTGEVVHAQRVLRF